MNVLERGAMMVSDSSFDYGLRAIAKEEIPAAYAKVMMEEPTIVVAA